uniref:Reverse transcriptase domain-containing protein n=1 Tax=Tanacetum cinerariifolium TaxID=118510 RepID=A0A6L2KHQ8_TANCI|nr:hypothetical protein [Tanacetum cinerariifolium]
MTSDLPIEEPDNSLSMRDEHLSTIPETESDEVIKSSVKNLVPIPSESEVTSDNEKIISTKIDPHYFNAESNLLESLLNQDTMIDSSPKFNYLLEEFSSKLAHIDLISPGIKEADFDLEEEIRPVENLLYDNSSQRPPEELNAEISDMILESLSPFLILVEDSNSHMEEIDLFLIMDDLMPPGIENDDYDSEGGIYFLEELLSNDPLPLPENESSNFDHHDDPSFPRPPLKPPDVEVFFDFEPDMGVLTTKVVKVFDTLLPSSFENKDKVFKPGILSYFLVSHQDKTTSDFFENPMMMYGGDIPFLDILIAPDLEASRARGFVHRPLEPQSLAYGDSIS